MGAFLPLHPALQQHPGPQDSHALLLRGVCGLRSVIPYRSNCERGRGSDFDRRLRRMGRPVHPSGICFHGSGIHSCAAGRIQPVLGLSGHNPPGGKKSGPVHAGRRRSVSIGRHIRLPLRRRPVFLPLWHHVQPLFRGIDYRGHAEISATGTAGSFTQRDHLQHAGQPHSGGLWGSVRLLLLRVPVSKRPGQAALLRDGRLGGGHCPTAFIEPAPALGRWVVPSRAIRPFAGPGAVQPGNQGHHGPGQHLGIPDRIGATSHGGQ